MFHWLGFLLKKKSKLSILTISVKVKEKKVHVQFEELKDKGIKCYVWVKKGRCYHASLAAQNSSVSTHRDGK